MKTQIRSLAARMLAITVVATMLAGAAPAFASVIQDLGHEPVRAKFAEALTPLPAPVVKLGRVVAEPNAVEAVAEVVQVAEEAAPVVPAVSNPAGEAALVSAATRAQAALPAPTPAATSSKPQATGTSSGPATRTTSTSSGDELSQAKSILAGLIARYPILAGTTVSFGSTPGGAQAVAYYMSGRIIINPNHTASLSTLLNHEVWHVIDWRDNGRIDWGENIPPK